VLLTIFLTSRDKKGQGLIATGGAVNVKPKNKPKPKVVKEVIISNQAPKAPAFNLAAYNGKGKGKKKQKQQQPKGMKKFDWGAIARAIQK